MSNTKKIKVLNITFYNFLSRIVFFAFVFCANVYTSRILNPVDFGKLQYINFSIAILWTFFNFGGAATLQRYYAQAFRNGSGIQFRQLHQFFLLAVTVSVVVSSAVWVMYSNYNARPVKGMLLIYLSSLVISNYLQVMAQATFSFAKLAFGNTCIAVAGFLLLLTFLPTHGMDAYVYVFTAVNFLNAFWSLWVWLSATKMNEQLQHTETRFTSNQLYGTAAALAISSVLAAILWQRTELYFIRRHAGFDELAVYGVALSLLALLVEFFRMLPGAMMPYFSAHKDEGVKNAGVFYAFMRYYGWLLVFIFLYAGVESHRIIHFIYTDRYIASADILRILLWGYACGALSFLATQLHMALGKNTFLIVQDTLAAVFVLAGCVWLIPTYGTVGAAWLKSSVVAYMGVAAIVYTVVRVKFHYPIRYLILSFLCAAVIVYLLRNWMNESLLLFGLKTALAFALYVALSISVGVIEKQMIKRVWQRIVGVLR
ncbi:MAG: lipopolysaccharide biosynthesis protein [Bacteroidota bacterium]|jgi:O-antigen/teichoic acid export membrane protein